MSGWTTQLVEGVAAYLADAGVGTWRPDGLYGPDDVGIYLRVSPSTPDRCIVLTTYPVRDSPQISDTLLGLQVRVRGTTDPRVVDDLADAVYEQLHGVEYPDVGEVAVVQMYRQSYAQLGQDAVKRWERSENYYVSAMRPSLHRTD